MLRFNIGNYFIMFLWLGVPTVVLRMLRLLRLGACATTLLLAMSVGVAVGASTTIRILTLVGNSYLDPSLGVGLSLHLISAFTNSLMASLLNASCSLLNSLALMIINSSLISWNAPPIASLISLNTVSSSLAIT